MKRRDALGALTAFGAALTGCSMPTGMGQSGGKLEVSFTTTATERYPIKLQLLDADGTVIDEFETELSPGQTETPTFSESGFDSGPYTVSIESDADSASFEWSVTDCPRLELDVTLRDDGRLEYDGTCSSE